ncbi:MULTISPECIES: SURF1 family protein [Halomonadaceae]|uniref:SURF1 family protein n=1 Tax=Halomonadaceae TaxID=28256 RepID=UPI000489EF06|nr:MULTISPECIES: SURF1 family protein [Halomonas]NAO98556.1 SURF1 family protein [Halomonas sp. MG34]PKH62256.1 SURF1 family protein [Halomonas sp. Choline-3u-9]QGQ70701.1 SURF1 family protein [Halomonas sp. PA16-9]
MMNPSRQWRFYSWYLFWSLLVALGISLGLWQWERADDKRLAIAVRDAAPTLVQPTEQPAQGAQVTLRGQYLAEQTLYLDNRVVDGRVGVAVLTPLRDSFGQLWLVQRGFLATGPRRETPQTTTPSGTVEVIGEWQEVQSGGPLYGENREGARLQQLSLEPWHASLGTFSYPGWLHASEGDGVLIPWWEANVMPPSRHMGYAFQWWGLALAALMVMFIGGYKLRRDGADKKALVNKNKQR